MAESTIITLKLSAEAQITVDSIKRSFESDEQVINRILETLSGISPDFDHFFGDPRDGRGRSGE